MEWEFAERTAHEAVDAMLAMPYEPSRNFKTIWPGMWCDFASIAIAEALRVRGLGDWTFVDAGLDSGPSGHAWLEYRPNGIHADFSIDATLHQFSRHTKPYYGPGLTPAAAEFTEVRFAGPWRDWPVLSRRPEYHTFVEATLSEMGDAGTSSPLSG
jgi:hypothetical protein